jgi:hypothetical protein
VYALPETGIAEASSAKARAEKTQVTPARIEGQDDRRTRGRDRLADDHEDAGADDCAEAERGEVEGADRSLELGLLLVGFVDQDVDRLRREQA